MKTEQRQANSLRLDSHWPNQTARVEFQTFAVNPDGSETVLRDPDHNLILDQGLDAKASATWEQLFRYVAIGTSANPTQRDSGPTTFSRAANTVTASANFFDPADVGRLFKFDSGEECYITGYTDATHVTVNVAGVVAASPGTIWYVNDVGLFAEQKRSGTYTSAGGDNGISYNGATGEFTLKRTVTFPVEVGAVTYNEIGWSSSAVAGSNITGRAVISGGDALAAGQAYKVVVRFIIAVTPIVSVVVANNGTGLDTTGHAALESMLVALSDIQANGSNNYLGGLEISGDSGYNQMLLINAAFALNPNSGGVTHSAIGIKNFPTYAAYVAGSYQRKMTWNYAQAEGNDTIYGYSIRSSNDGSCIYTLRLDTPFVKTSDYTLSIDFTISWDRVLVNT